MRTIAMTILVFSLAACLPRHHDSTLTAAVPSASAAMSIDTVRSLIAERSLKSVDELIGALPESYRQFATVGFRSASLQRASADRPRVVLFGPDASLILAFVGDGELEAISFNTTTRRFEFYEIHERQGEHLAVSDQNPDGKCTSCHGGKSLRPNWQAYPDWPGFLGSQDDAAPNGSEELTATERFVKAYKTLPRYRHLLNLEEKYTVHREIPSVSQVTPGVTVSNFRTPINRALTVALARRNLQRLAKLLHEQPAYATHKYLLASILADCLPRPDGAYSDKPAVPRAQYDEIERRKPELAGLFTTGGTIHERLRHANEKLALGFDVDVANWSMSHRLGVTDAGKEHVPRNPFDDSARGPASAAEPSTLYFLPAALAELDTDLGDLSSHLCNALHLPLNVATATGAVDGRHFCAAAQGRDADGHQTTCRAIATKWLSTLQQ